MSRPEPTSDALRRRRRRLNALCAVLLLAGAGVGAWAASRLLPAHARWEYENRREYRDIPSFEAPCVLEVDIWYQGDAPQGIRIENAGIGLNRLQQEDDTAGKKLTVWCEVSAGDVEGTDPGEWALSLVPMDNLELTYQVRTEPSHEHAKADVSFLRDEDGRRWIAIDAAYGYLRDDSAIRALVHLEGNTYRPTVMDWTFDGEAGQVLACLDAIVEERDIKDKEASSCNVTIMCGGTDRYGDPIQVNEKASVRMKEWPEYDETAWGDVAGWPDGTDDYLDQLDPHRRNAAPGAAAEDSAGQEGG